MMVELQRISSHLVWLGTHAIDLGAMSVFLYCFREREEILKIFEMFAGQRMMTSYIRIGGVALQPPAGWRQAIDKFLKYMPSRVDEYETLLTENRIWMGRTKNIGVHHRGRRHRAEHDRAHAFARRASHTTTGNCFRIRVTRNLILMFPRARIRIVSRVT